MPDLKITELPAATTPLLSNEEFALVQGGITKKAEVSNLGADVYASVISLKYDDLNISKNDSLSVKQNAIATYLNSYNKQDNETLIVKLYEPNYNFEITADWSGNGVTDTASFITYFEANSNGTGTVVNDFFLSAGVLKCEITTNATTLTLSNISLSNLGNLESLSTLTSLDLSNNNITDMSSLYYLQNLITLNLQQNQLNLIVGLENSINLTSVNLSFNLFDNTGYLNSEDWVNRQNNFNSICNFIFTNNVNSITGTDLETILLTKNTTITA